MLFNLKEKLVWVTGHNGLAGSAIFRRLKDEGCEVLTTSRKDVDLCNPNEVDNYVSQKKPDLIINCAGKVGGIMANINFPVNFLYENLMIQTNIIKSAYKNSVEKLLLLGSSCIYPKNVEQPINETSFMNGELEKTNEYYAISKIAGIKLCQAYRKQYDQDFICVMPTNLYGPNDNFKEENSHVPAALLDRFHKAKVNKLENVKVWGNGKVFREFLYVDDFADACIFLVQNYSEEQIINIGTGHEIKIVEFAKLIANVINYDGEIIFDESKPSGIPKKLLDVSKINSLGWKSKIELEDGLTKFYRWYLSSLENLRR